jgi:excisionase family DNA binding protein
VDDELIRGAEVARRLCVTPRCVRAWAREGRIPAVKLSGKTYRYSWRRVLEALGLDPATLPAADRPGEG